ncbi:sigma-70 family RNA polymerase sigma factor [uncultured Arcticibacterium sp.]|uniref:RNA polymerase sigma factor n=1 Tax=uncultured Arcticibacterium sp. TaxID=2173042 RepID=UPI0030F6B5EA
MKQIDLLKSGDQLALKAFYGEHKSAFLFFGNRYDLDREELIDVYQDACIVLFEKLKAGKLEDVNSSLKTYLFGIGKNLIFKRFKQKAKVVDLDTVEITSFEDPFKDDETLEEKRMRAAFVKLGGQCQEVLRLFYYEEKSLDEIVSILTYKDKNVLKSQKSRCLKQLKDLVKQNG